ncbi:hypothetical protein K469DRAFT_692365 [Zopfia rhizophila CBS 207.26]|uniref:Uncharacterized protein n=1 Tax=Zopfia rhizophila CBS 207.26 TaxID=1314779 RepID=A0A6A6DNR4_9PEZI|nr:hypothetical protein K469DRAFT_692365 [Zopfia rhizophila CBS 207.26]
MDVWLCLVWLCLVWLCLRLVTEYANKNPQFNKIAVTMTATVTIESTATPTTLSGSPHFASADSLPARPTSPTAQLLSSVKRSSPPKWTKRSFLKNVPAGPDDRFGDQAGGVRDAQVRRVVDEPGVREEHPAGGLVELFFCGAHSLDAAVLVLIVSVAVAFSCWSVEQEIRFPERVAEQAGQARQPEVVVYAREPECGELVGQKITEFSVTLFRADDTDFIDNRCGEDVEYLGRLILWKKT